ncbi:MAG: hypothetical protein JWO21_1541 [Solirubrobacterales bacterium]|nr:hypothetical protein [Solirubrobacterales bacterium]
MKPWRVLWICVLAGFAVGATSASAASLEYGFCQKVSVGAGAYGTAGCTALGGERKYEWTPLGASETVPFTTVKRESPALVEMVVLQPANPPGFNEEIATVRCTNELSSEGAYIGENEVLGIVLEFTGCELTAFLDGTHLYKAKCTSAGANEGTVITSRLAGSSGLIAKGVEPTKDKAGLDLKAETGETFAEFTCGSAPMVVRGSVIAPVKTNRMLASQPITYQAKYEKQKVQKFESMPRDVLEADLNERGYGPLGLKFSTKLQTVRKIELRDCKPGC